MGISSSAPRALTSIYDFNRQTGTITVKDTSVVKELVEEDIRDAMGISQETEIVQSSPMGRMVEWLTLCFASVQNVNVQNYMQMLISSAAGQQLDAIAQWFMIVRKPALATRVTVKITGNAGLTVPAGLQASSTDNNNFVLESDVTLDENGYGTGVFVCTKFGPVFCAKGTLNNIDIALVGLESIINESDGDTGRNIETDDELRERIENSRFYGIGFVGAMKNALENIEGVKSSIVLENNTGGRLYVDGVSLDPHSILVCIDGNVDDEDFQQEVAKAIYDNKPCGTGYTTTATPTDNLKTVPYADPYGTKYNVYFYKPTETPVRIWMSVKKRSYSGVDIQSDVRKAITDWANGKYFALGEDVYANELIRVVENAIPGIIVVSAVVNDGGSDSQTHSNELTGNVANYVDVAGYSKATFNADDITVETINT